MHRKREAVDSMDIEDVSKVVFLRWPVQLCIYPNRATLRIETDHNARKIQNDASLVSIMRAKLGELQEEKAERELNHLKQLVCIGQCIYNIAMIFFVDSGHFEGRKCGF